MREGYGRSGGYGRSIGISGGLRLPNRQADVSVPRRAQVRRATAAGGVEEVVSFSTVPVTGNFLNDGCSERCLTMVFTPNLNIATAIVSIRPFGEAVAGHDVK